MKRTLRYLFSCLLIIAISVPYELATAAQSSARGQVRVHIMKSVKIQTKYQANSLMISNKDIERGYTEVENGTIYSVISNTQDGYMLSYAVTNNPFRQVVVKDGRRFIKLHNAEGILHMPYKKSLRQGQIKQLSYRFYLNQNVPPGRYPWPIRLQGENSI